MTGRLISLLGDSPDAVASKAVAAERRLPGAHFGESRGQVRWWRWTGSTTSLPAVPMLTACRGSHFAIRERMQTLEERLTAVFFRIHRSAIVRRPHRHATRHSGGDYGSA